MMMRRQRGREGRVQVWYCHPHQWYLRAPPPRSPRRTRPLPALDPSKLNKVYTFRSTTHLITDCLFRRVNDIICSSDPSEFTTPQATPLDTNIASEFISSLKVPTYPRAAVTVCAMPCTDVCKMAISPPNV